MHRPSIKINKGCERMEVLEEKIKEFLTLTSGYGDGYGSGSGDGSGDGYGSGSGDGYGSDYGDGYGDGYGSGYGDGYGSGYGDGSGILSYNNNKIYIVDDVNTIITHIKNNIAKGFILNEDFTKDECYIAKGHNYFAHGKTIKKAIENLQEKIFNTLEPEEKIEEFKKTFKKDKKYKGVEFYKWHNKLTGSCEMGRNSFVKNHNIDLDDEFTVKEFIKITENDYGGDIIKMLRKDYI